MSTPFPELTTQCWLWRLERGDGVTLGFTSHDRVLFIDNLTYYPSPGILPTSIMLEDGLEAGGLEIEGALSSDAITRDDLVAGRWEGARISIYRTSWELPVLNQPIIIATLGAISMAGNGFSAELFGLQKQLEKGIVPATSPTCRAQFCGADCALNRRRFEHSATVINGTGGQLLVTMSPDAPIGSLNYGTLRWLTGANSGASQAIIIHNGNNLTLLDPPEHPATAGDILLLIQGCDKNIATCATRFANARNFRGEPHLPGNDLLSRYPGAG